MTSIGEHKKLINSPDTSKNNKLGSTRAREVGRKNQKYCKKEMPERKLKAELYIYIQQVGTTDDNRMDDDGRPATGDGSSFIQPLPASAS